MILKLSDFKIWYQEISINYFFSHSIFRKMNTVLVFMLLFKWIIPIISILFLFLTGLYIQVETNIFFHICMKLLDMFVLESQEDIEKR